MNNECSTAGLDKKEGSELQCGIGQDAAMDASLRNTIRWIVGYLPEI